MRDKKEALKSREETKSPGPLRRFIRFWCILIASGLCAALLILLVLVFLNNPPDSPPLPPRGEENLRPESDGSLTLTVEKGESALSVGKRLERARVIRSHYFWRLLSSFVPGSIKSGIYRLELPASQTALYSLLVTGRQLLLRVTIPEGVTLKKTARLLAEAGVCGEEEFLAAAGSPELREEYRTPGETLEGYLYPDTYLFPPAFPPERVIRTMADTFFTRLEEFAPGALSLSPEELNRRVIIASIVEREYRVPGEAPLMAGVFYNRLNIGMALQSCATVEYVITEIQGKPHPEALLTADTRIEDPYNTYVYPGLPPGPISAPGKTALLAAFQPAPSDFLYFRLTDPVSGKHYFSRTLDEHIQGGLLYVKGP